MEETILISYINDFIFCPISIYFHKLYGKMETSLYQTGYQIEGTNAHKTIEEGKYSTSKSCLQGIEVYSEKYNIIGKIDLYDEKKKVLTERKNKIIKVYDGYVFQMYAQYYALKEMGYEVEQMRLYSMKDNKVYRVDLPEENKEMKEKFECVIKEMMSFDADKFVQTNKEKCKQCIYEPICDRSKVSC